MTADTYWIYILASRQHGALYIGHSERVTGPAAQALVSDGISTYRHKGAPSR